MFNIYFTSPIKRYCAGSKKHVFDLTVLKVSFGDTLFGKNLIITIFNLCIAINFNK